MAEQRCGRMALQDGAAGVAGQPALPGLGKGHVRSLAQGAAARHRKHPSRQWAGPENPGL